MWIIIIFIILAFIAGILTYIPMLIHVTMLKVQLAIIVLTWVLAFIAVWDRQRRYSAEQKRRLLAAEESDKSNVAENEKRKKVAIRYNEEEIRTCKSKIRELREEMRPYEEKLMQLDILGQDDWNLNEVDFLIKTLESHRANDIAGALQLYDAEVRRKHDEAMKEIDRRLERQRAEWERSEQRRRDEEQRRHNDRMEDLERQRLKEAEKARKEIERLTSN
ncbi:MAG: hypothetical protein E7260_12340 [Lachnospiraceae bacterium]|nr:hypothetical protein [Lachnospiraceae bacterium]